MKKSTILFCVAALVVVFYPHALRAQTTIEVSDTIWTDETWSADTVKVTGNITLMDDLTLTIEPGTYIKFQGYYYMNIMGTILANGAVNDTIVFSVADTTDFHKLDVTDGSWHGMIFNNYANIGADGGMTDNDTSILNICKFEYVKNIYNTEFIWGTIEVGQFSRLVISNCVIQHNYTFYRGGGLLLYQDADIQVINNLIRHNRAEQWAGGIFISNSQPTIKGNTITHNRTLSEDPSFGKGGGIGVIGMNPIIRDNIITYNSAIYGSGIGLRNSFSLIHGNTIAYNTGYDILPDVRSIGGAIYMEETSSPLIRNNLISNNQATEAGGIYAINSQPDIINNLIVNNTGVESGGAYFGWNSDGSLINNTISHNESPFGAALEMTNCRPLFINNIIGDNGGFEIHLQDKFTHLTVENNIIVNGESTIWGAGTYDIVSLIEENPLFKSAAAGMGSGNEGLTGTDWSVENNSPALNAGISKLGNIPLPQKDLQGNSRIHHDIIDIGAYEVHIPKITFADTIKSDTTWIADTVAITGNVTVNDEVHLTILPGTYVEFQDTFHLKINGTLYAEGKPGNMIRFARNVNDTAGFHNLWIADGGWKGIVFDNSYDGMNNEMINNDTSVIKYCHFSFAKFPNSHFFGGAIQIRYFANIKIAHCVFENNKSFYGAGAITMEVTDIIISNCEFYKNYGDEGGAIVGNLSDVVLKNNIFDENNAFNWGGAVRLRSSDAIIRDNTFINNYADWGGAYYSEQTKALIQNNFFSNNHANNFGGALVLAYKDFQLINNVIVNNSASQRGGAIYFVYVDDALTANNTIANNWSRRGGAFYNALVNHRSYNDIIYGNEVLPLGDIYRGNQYFIWSVQSDISFNHSNLQGGTDDFFIYNGTIFLGELTDCIDSMPQFINPSEGAGNIFDGINSNWNLKSISPCINAGSTQTIGSLLSNVDFAGNPRVFDNVLDIGAYECQYGLPVITRQPLNQVACTGDTVILAVQTQYQSYYQWQKDGVDIPGATGNELRTDSITQAADGNYQCIVSNSFGSVASVPVYVVARSAPEIILQPEDTWAVEGEKAIIGSNASGTPPIHYQWFKETLELPGKRYPELWIFDTGPNMEGEYHCLISNACGSVSTDTVQLYLAPQICMVTVDTASGHNLVVWEKNSSAPVESYNVYRESIVAGEYDLIGNIAADDLSVFEDTMADPFSQGYIYKITAIDPDDNESDLNLCKPHKTIHLLTSINTEEYSIQCDWDHYYGFDYGTFIIYRGIKGNPLDSIHAISRSFNTWIDRTSAENVDYVYRIAARRLEACYPTGNAKAGSGPYSHSMSNVDDNRLQATGRVDLKSVGTLQIFPNPVSDHTTIRFPNPDHSDYQLVIRDLSGKAVLLMSKITEEQVTIRRGNLKAGYYSVEIIGDKIYRGKMVIE